MESNPVLQFSLIIPARNEENYLPRLLDSVDTARMNYHRGSDAVEVIVSDNCSTDKTAEIAESRGCVVVKEEKRIIAAVRNAGAAAATGRLSVFWTQTARSIRTHSMLSIRSFQAERWSGAQQELPLIE